jgi:hypothetical protein
MLNRTNLTLSALALTNGLNLGTRSFAAQASVNTNGDLARIRQVHHGLMREGMMWYSVVSIPKPRLGIPVVPDSFSKIQQPRFGCVLSQQGVFAVDVPVEPEPRPADLVDRPEPRDLDRPDSIPTIFAAWAKATKPSLDCQASLTWKSCGNHGLNRSTSRATSTRSMAATQSTSGK